MLDPLATTPGRKIGLLHDQRELSELSAHDGRSGLSASWGNIPQSTDRHLVHFRSHLRNVRDQFLTIWNCCFRKLITDVWRSLECSRMAPR